MKKSRPLRKQYRTTDEMTEGTLGNRRHGKGRQVEQRRRKPRKERQRYLKFSSPYYDPHPVKER